MNIKEIDIIDLDPEPANNIENQELLKDWWKLAIPDDVHANINYGPKFKIIFSIIDECNKVGDKL